MNTSHNWPAQRKATPEEEAGIRELAALDQTSRAYVEGAVKLLDTLCDLSLTDEIKRIAKEVRNAKP